MAACPSASDNLSPQSKWEAAKRESVESAFRAFKQFADSDASELIIDALRYVKRTTHASDKDVLLLKSIADQASKRIMEIGDPKGLGVLIDCLNLGVEYESTGPKRQNRMLAVMSFGNLARDQLVDRLNDAEGHIEREGCDDERAMTLTLGNFRDSAAVPALIAAWCRFYNQDFSIEIQHALLDLGKAAKPALLEVLENPEAALLREPSTLTDRTEHLGQFASGLATNEKNKAISDFREEVTKVVGYIDAVLGKAEEARHLLQNYAAMSFGDLSVLPSDRYHTAHYQSATGAAEPFDMFVKPFGDWGKAYYISVRVGRGRNPSAIVTDTGKVFGL